MVAHVGGVPVQCQVFGPRMLAIVSLPTLAFLSASRRALPGTLVQSEIPPMQSDAGPHRRSFGFNISQQIRAS